MQPHALVSDPRRLRRWLREMENDMAKSPTLSEAMRMQPAELRKRLTEHSVSLVSLIFMLSSPTQHGILLEYFN